MWTNWVLIAVIVIIVSLGGALVDKLLPFLTGERKRNQLAENGVPDRATILSIEQTGTYFNTQPQCRIRVRIEPPNSPPFEAIATEVVQLTDIPQFQPGQVVTVAFDPTNPTQAAITGLGYVSITAAEASRMAEESHALEQRLNASNSAMAAGAIITEFSPTGAFVTGENPLAVLKVKVLPTGEAPFDSVIVGAFDGQSLAKYQPGKEIHVLFDPADRARVTFDLSRTEHELSRG